MQVRCAEPQYVRLGVRKGSDREFGKAPLGAVAGCVCDAILCAAENSPIRLYDMVLGALLLRLQSTRGCCEHRLHCPNTRENGWPSKSNVTLLIT